MPQTSKFISKSVSKIDCCHFYSSMINHPYFGLTWHHHTTWTVLDWYQQNQVHFVPKVFNPPNCMELRATEKYWTLVKHQPKKIWEKAISFKNFWIKWKRLPRKYQNLLQNLMERVKGNVWKFSMREKVQWFLVWNINIFRSVNVNYVHFQMFIFFSLTLVYGFYWVHALL